MKKIIVLLLILFVQLAISGCSSQTPQVTGILQGHVTIGPLIPVIQTGVPEPTPAPEMYTERKVVIFSEDGQNEIMQVNIDGRGNYEVSLPVGRYTIDIIHLGIDSALGLPIVINIVADQITFLDIDIDTGIR